MLAEKKFNKTDFFRREKINCQFDGKQSVLTAENFSVHNYIIIYIVIKQLFPEIFQPRKLNFSVPKKKPHTNYLSSGWEYLKHKIGS